MYPLRLAMCIKGVKSRIKVPLVRLPLYGRAHPQSAPLRQFTTTRQ